MALGTWWAGSLFVLPLCSWLDAEHHFCLLDPIMTLDTKLTMALAGCSGSCSANRWHSFSVSLWAFLATKPKILEGGDRNQHKCFSSSSSSTEEAKIHPSSELQGALRRFFHPSRHSHSHLKKVFFSSFSTKLPTVQLSVKTYFAVEPLPCGHLSEK